MKAASISISEEFRIGLTLRFPRFKKLRMDKDWKSALSVQEFLDLKSNVEKEQKEKEFTVDNSRRKRVKTSTKKPLAIAGYNEAKVEYSGPSGNVFDKMNFCIIPLPVSLILLTQSLVIMTGTNGPKKKDKAELEQLVKVNGGQIYQTNSAAPRIVCIADRRTVKVASLQKSAREDIIRPNWLLDCIRQNEIDRHLSSYLLPLEPRHMFFTREERRDEIADNVDVYNDSYARDVTPEELKTILDAAKPGKQQLAEDDDEIHEISEAVFQRSHEEGTTPPGWLFRGLTIHFHESADSSDSSH